MGPKEELSIKNLEFSRYTLLRYSLAIFFFSHLNWVLLLFLSKSVFAIVPIVFLLLAILPIYEQLILYGNQNKEFQLTHLKRYFVLQGIGNIVFLILSFVEFFYHLAFPFMAKNAQGTNGIRIFLLLGGVLTLFCLGKLKKISENKDRVYKQVIKYKKQIGVNE